ncbi:uncharacterized protein V6R79_022210 [Siganus canaliculatus]
MGGDKRRREKEENSAEEEGQGMRKRGCDETEGNSSYFAKCMLALAQVCACARRECGDKKTEAKTHNCRGLKMLQMEEIRLFTLLRQMCEEMSVPVKDHGKKPSTPTHEEQMCEEMSVPVKDHGKKPSTPTHEEQMCEEMSVPVKDHGKKPSTPTHEEQMCEEMSVPVKDHGKKPSTPTHEEPVVEFSSFQSSDEDYVLPTIRADEELSSDDFVPESYHDEDDSDASLSFSHFTPPL